MVGLLVRPFPLERIHKLLRSYSGLGETGEVVIAQRRSMGDRDGLNFISQFRKDRQPDAACLQLRMTSFDLFGMYYPLNQENGSGWRLDNSCYMGYSVWAWMPELQWGMLVKQDRDEIMAPIESLQHRLLFASLLLIITLLWVVQRLSKTLSQPIEELIDSVEQGELDNHPLSRVKEVNHLSQTLQRSVASLQEAVKRADKANQAKDEFLASMSHELRTPLSSIIGNSDLLAEQIGDQGSLDIVRSIEIAGRNQLALINDILDMSKIESGMFTIEKIPFNLSQLLKEIEQMLSAQAQDAGLELMIHEGSCGEFLLLGDAQRVGQILINLVGNAIKFTTSGKVTLTSWRDGEKSFFQVEDTGIGMSPEVMERLFKRFEQADGSISRRFGGSGLGLFISLNLAELMGGTIHVSSEEEVGSTFQLMLPLSQSDVPLEQRAVELQTDSVLNEQISGRVLIAEDTPEMQMLERRILEKMGITVTTADNGKEAVELALQDDFDLILMDMQMPVMDGIEATRELKKQGCRLPVIALTANVMQRHKEAFLEAGCDGFLAKPIDKQELRKTLKQHLGAPAQQRSAEPEFQEIDDEMMVIFRESAVKYRAEMMKALADKDWGQVRATAHTVKGSAASFGFPELSRMGMGICDAFDRGQMEQVPETAMDLVMALGKVTA